MIYGCNQRSSDSGHFQVEIDSLKIQLKDTYKPGFGEFMSAVQIHHAKLWFAGDKQNWKLADFEIHEIKESLDNIQKFLPERKESANIPTLYPAIDSVNEAIARQSPASFKSSYAFLTASCNNCHRMSEYDFNVVKAPDVPPFSNQDFSKPETAYR